MKFVRLLSLVAMLGAILVAPAFAQTPAPAKETPLLSIATKVATLDNVIDDTYFWVSDHQVLFFRLAHDPYTKQEQADLAPLISRPLPKDFRPGHFRIFISDTQTNSLTPLQPFTQDHPNAFPAIPFTVSMEGVPNSEWTAYNPPDCQLSPDGNWLLWSTFTLNSVTSFATRIDGHGQVTWPESGGDAVWDPDSHHWTELGESESARGYVMAMIRDTATPAYKHLVKFTPPADGIAQGMTANGSLVLADYDSERYGQPVKIMIYGLSGPTATTHSYQVSVPDGKVIPFGIALSLSGDRLAWILETDDRFGTSENGAYALYTCGLDGTNWQMIGTMSGYTAPTEVNHQGYYYPETLRWLPDGKHLSFIFRNALYTVPVDREQPAHAGGEAITTGQALAEERSARAMLEKVVAVSYGPPAAELLSNQTGARTAADVYLGLGMVAQMERFEKGSDRASLRRMASQVAAFGKKYGLKSGSFSQPNMAALEAHGRQFYRAALVLVDRLPTEIPPGLAFNIETPVGLLPKKIGDYSFDAVSPTEVQITCKEKLGGRLSAWLEDGKWRLDLCSSGVPFYPS